VTSPVAATISATGISAPTYPQILAYLVTQFQAIFGSDSYLGADSQDGQWIAINAQAISDCNAAVVAAYNSFSPTTGQGNGLSSNVKINGLSRIAGSYSTATLTIVGQASTVIANGLAQDASGNTWALPPSVTIPVGGTINVTAACTSIGAITAAANAINQIATPTQGWQTVNNAAQAVPGNGVETDAALRVRQAVSVALPSVTVFSGIIAAIQQVPGVTRTTAYENNTNSTNANGIPANTLCFVVECPAATQAAVAQAIASKMPPGIATYGNVATVITDTAGTTRTVNQQTPTESTFTATIQVHTLNGWASSTVALIQAAVSAYFTSVPIGGVVNVAAVTAAAQLLGSLQAPTYLVKTVQINKNAGAYQGTDITLTFAEAATPGTTVVTTV
jgi:uncharacterized phage protein gp47/JayE